jgi:hypothetical protein
MVVFSFSAIAELKQSVNNVAIKSFIVFIFTSLFI